MKKAITTAKKSARRNYDYRVLWLAVREALDRIRPLSDQEARAFFHAPRGNSKTGEIPAWSLMPGPSCPGRACGTCLLTGCYACKNAFRGGYKFSEESGRPDGKINMTLRAWAENTALVLNRLPVFVDCMRGFLAEYSQAGGGLFRIHAAGDFVTLAYAQAWAALAAEFPAVTFLAFTKSWEAAEAVPFDSLDNFSLVLSAWPGLPVPDALRERYRVSWCQDGTETRIPADAMHCPGDCDSCGLCWYLAGIGRDIWFTKH